MTNGNSIVGIPQSMHDSEISEVFASERHFGNACGSSVISQVTQLETIHNRKSNLVKEKHGL